MSIKDTKKKMLKKAVKSAAKEEPKAHEMAEPKNVEAKEKMMKSEDMPMNKFKNLKKK